jgi:hypothetical protein
VNNYAFDVGEPGYSLYIPSEFALQIYDNLMKVGRDYGIRELNIGRNHLKGQCHELDIFLKVLIF